MTPSTLYIGLDAGGSKTKLVTRSVQHDDLVLIGPAANLTTSGLEWTVKTFSDLVREAVAQHSELKIGGLCAGVAGAGRAEDRAELVQALREELGPLAPEHLLIVHDAVIAVEAAFEGGSGVVLIAGTGSVGFARTPDGRLHRVGGWGLLLGDEGSGYMIGLNGLKAVAGAMDGGPQTQIQTLVAEHLNVRTPDELIHHVYQKRARIPDVAPFILAAATDGDAVAQQIVHDQSAMLAEQVVWLFNRCPSVEHRIALVGGLCGHPYYRSILEEALTARLPEWVVSAPAHEPVEGAVRLAIHPPPAEVTAS